MTVVQQRALVACLTAAALYALWLLADGTRPYLRRNAPVQVEIARGTSARAIARQLQDIGAIRSHRTFLLLCLLRTGDTLKAGEYHFDYPSSAWQVLQKLVRGDIFYHVLTVPEGYNRFEVADLVASKGLATKDDFLKATEDATRIDDLHPAASDLEGYLFPDTYHIASKTGAGEIVQAMVNRFRQVYTGLAQDGNERSIHEVVTLASLVEKETPVPEERRLVAAVFYNRLRRNMALQCDPTVVYAAILEGRFAKMRYDGKIRQSMLNSSSPYNTYAHRGLPPGPIANPGEASLRAALRPAPADFLYFVADSNGGHAFSRTLAEHNRAVSSYRRGSPQ
ncbi:MAG: endolytic transglycosylase MltG [Acidobacteria bacterium]|nr:endolytic transglycosylase MltG [Acidobacteriota bacterium]